MVALTILVVVIAYLIGMKFGHWFANDDDALLDVLTESNRTPVSERERRSYGPSPTALNEQTVRLRLKSCQGFVDGRRSRVHSNFVNMRKPS